MDALSREYHNNPIQNIRPFSIVNDLEKTADLVELCFADTLDADSRRYLNHMHNVSRNKSTLRWARFLPSLATLPFNGFVWEENDRLVGNITLIPYYVKGKRFFLIANVAVHPEFRRRGIAHLLTVHAMEYIKQQGVSSIWLHARDENPYAIKLYERLGFLERARRTSWENDPNSTPQQNLNETYIAPLNSKDWKYHKEWIMTNYPPELSWHMPLNIGSLRPGIWGILHRNVMNDYIVQWGVFQNNKILGAVSWQETSSHANMLWLSVPPNAHDRIVTALLLYAQNHAPSSRPMKLNFTTDQYIDAIQKAGFSKQQTLIWMSYTFP
jgi:ribosomal protein S18 acetylase RimI-like enzyme